MSEVTFDPISEFLTWFAEAQQTPLKDPNAMAIATVDETGTPAVRMVLMKHFDQEGLVFYTNFQSAKSRSIQAQGENAKISACFFWETTRKQVRVTGRVSEVEAAEADAYFASRARESQIGAWASLQSQPLSSRDVFEGRYHDLVKLYEGQTVPRPPHWSGWRIKPERMEFWVEKPFRLHDRYVYTRSSGAWSRTLLYP